MSDKKKVKVVLFDFDGTLSAGDSNTEFWKYCFAHSIRPWLFLPVFLLGCIVKIISMFTFHKHAVGKIDLLWRELMRMYLSRNMVKKLAPGFIKKHMQKRFGWAAEQVAKEKAAGNFVICISAGPDFLIDKLVGDMDFNAVICSIMDENRPWKYDFLCWGDNKVLALADYANMLFVRNPEYNIDTIENALDGIDVVRTYSDSRSDLPIMRLAREEVWIDPKTGIRK